jgi:hypothetical protein
VLADLSCTFDLLQGKALTSLTRHCKLTVSAELCNTEKVKFTEIMFKYSFATSAKRHGSVTLRWEYQTVNIAQGVIAVRFENRTGKGKGASVCVVKACRGSRGVAPLILNLSARRRGVVNITLRPLYPQKSTPLPFG